jgi:hypothetical protein
LRFVFLFSPELHKILIILHLGITSGWGGEVDGLLSSSEKTQSTDALNSSVSLGAAVLGLMVAVCVLADTFP